MAASSRRLLSVVLLSLALSAFAQDAESASAAAHVLRAANIDARKAGEYLSRPVAGSGWVWRWGLIEGRETIALVAKTFEGGQVELSADERISIVKTQATNQLLLAHAAIDRKAVEYKTRLAAKAAYASALPEVIAAVSGSIGPSAEFFVAQDGKAVACLARVQSALVQVTRVTLKDETEIWSQYGIALLALARNSLSVSDYQGATRYLLELKKQRLESVDLYLLLRDAYVLAGQIEEARRVEDYIAASYPPPADATGMQQ